VASRQKRGGKLTCSPSQKAVGRASVPLRLSTAIPKFKRVLHEGPGWGLILKLAFKRPVKPGIVIRLIAAVSY
jgi:hypothetical protein